MVEKPCHFRKVGYTKLKRREAKGYRRRPVKNIRAGSYAFLRALTLSMVLTETYCSDSAFYRRFRALSEAADDSKESWVTGSYYTKTRSGRKYGFDLGESSDAIC